MKKALLLPFFSFVVVQLYGQTGNTHNFSKKNTAISKSYVEQSSGIHPANLVNRSVIASDDFSSASNWTLTQNGTNGNWQITSTTPTDQAQYMGAMNSSTAGNGFATFNATTYYLSSAAGNQDATLEYNQVLDLSSYTSINVSYEERCRVGDVGTTFLEVSSDGGASWTTFQGHQHVSPYTVTQGIVIADISAVAAASSTVKIRFRWTSPLYTAYGWMIDDFSVNSGATDDLMFDYVGMLDLNLYTETRTEVTYTRVPVDQAGSVSFAGRMQNIGSSTESNCRINAIVDNSSGNYSNDSSFLQTLSPSQYSFGDTILWNPSNVVDDYYVYYNARYDNSISDATSVNNEKSDTFKITTNEWARDNDHYLLAGINDGVNSFVLGNVFRCYANTNMNGVQVAFMPGTDTGVVTCAQLYTIDASGNMVLVADNCGTPAEITLDSTMISTPGNVVWVNYELCYPLQAGEQYLAAFQHYGGPDSVAVMVSDNYADTNSVFLLDGASNTWFYAVSTPKIRMTTGLCNSAGCSAEFVWYADTTQNAVYVNNTTTYITGATFTWDFGDGSTGTGINPTHFYSNYGSYLVCVNVDDGFSCHDVFCDTITYMPFSGNANDRSGFTLFVTGNTNGIEEIEKVENFIAYPNPTEGLLTVKFSGNTTESASLIVTDITGRQVMQLPVNISISDTQVTLSTDKLSRGIYNLTLTDKNNSAIKTLRFVKQ